METVLTVLLVRFALIAAVVVALALVVLAVVLVLHRRGKGDQARRVAHTAAELAQRRIGR
ncbi:hypothetical protein [Amycolatopsis methanolica]|uniref:Uncharacterized protein n=1 Tax=Amycolatopsis methanolica 239 TaxID=1068978 RepID=A0A076MNG1_AMYME|nr:hypothetical protein [Amycolatopsis methanolica]AIJ20516.1 hypothetical protein AMETH_0424 [Amycolatopsis methanolica 239]